MNNESVIKTIIAQQEFQHLFQGFKQGTLADRELSKFLNLMECHPHLAHHFEKELMQSMLDSTIQPPQHYLYNIDTQTTFTESNVPEQRIRLPYVASENLAESNSDAWIYEEQDDYTFRLETRYNEDTEEHVFIAEVTKGNVDISNSTTIHLFDENENELEMLRDGEKVFRQTGIPGKTYIIKFESNRHGFSKQIRFKYVKGKQHDS